MEDIEARKAKPREKPYKISDERGLYLLVIPSGGKSWRMNYRVDGKQKTLSLGLYPEVSLAQARKKREDARKMLAEGLDPMAERAAVKAAKTAKETHTFEVIAKEWLDTLAPTWAPVTLEHARQRLEHDLFPDLGQKPIADITAPELLAVLRKIAARGAVHTAGRARADAGRVFRYAIATGRAERDPSADLRGALPTEKVKHRSAIVEPKQVGELMRAIEGYSGSPIVRAAFRLSPLVFLRPGELASAEWAEFDLDAGEWRIPGPRMKMKDLHIVPLSRQAVALLRDLHPLTGHGRFVFPAERAGSDRHMSRESIRAALIRMGYGPDSETPMTAHGFRGMASTLLHEQGWPSDVIERQLAHAERNKIKAAYNHAEYLPERRRMMQAWADYLDGLKAGAEVIPFRRPA